MVLRMGKTLEARTMPRPGWEQSRGVRSARTPATATCLYLESCCWTLAKKKGGSRLAVYSLRSQLTIITPACGLLGLFFGSVGHTSSRREESKSLTGTGEATATNVLDGKALIQQLTVH